MERFVRGLIVEAIFQLSADMAVNKEPGEEVLSGYLWEGLKSRPEDLGGGLLRGHNRKFNRKPPSIQVCDLSVCPKGWRV